MQSKRTTISVNEDVSRDISNLGERLFAATGVQFSVNQVLEYLLALEQGKVKPVARAVYE